MPSMESKTTVHKRKRFCSFRHDENKRGKVTQLFPPAPRAQTQKKRWEKFSACHEVSSGGRSSKPGAQGFRSRRSPFFDKEAALLRERDLEDRAKTSSVEIVRIRHVIFGILPNVNIIKTQSGCKFGEKCVSMHKRS